MNYEHPKEVVEGFDEIHELEKKMTVIESNRNLIVGPSEPLLEQESSNLAEQVKRVYNYQIFKIVMFCLIILITF